MIMLVAVVCSTIFALADSTTCRVYGSSNGNVATIENPYTNSMAETGYGYYVSVSVSLTKQAEEDIDVVINLYDGNHLIATRVAHFNKYASHKSVEFHGCGCEKGHTYEARIANATCE